MTLINNPTKETALPHYSAAKKETLNTLMKDQVFEHAIRILENHGAEFLTLERLSKGIGVSRGTLYNYFVDRKAIIEFVEERSSHPAPSFDSSDCQCSTRLICGNNHQELRELLRRL